MAMRLETENVRFIECKMLDELMMIGNEIEDAKETLAYIGGVHDMANQVIKVIRELGGK